MLTPVPAAVVLVWLPARCPRTPLGSPPCTYCPKKETRRWGGVHGARRGEGELHARPPPTSPCRKCCASTTMMRMLLDGWPADHRGGPRTSATRSVHRLAVPGGSAGGGPPPRACGASRRSAWRTDVSTWTARPPPPHQAANPPRCASIRICMCAGVWVGGGQGWEPLPFSAWRLYPAGGARCPTAGDTVRTTGMAVKLRRTQSTAPARPCEAPGCTANRWEGNSPAVLHPPSLPPAAVLHTHRTVRVCSTCR